MCLHAGDAAHLHFRASMSFPGVSRHRRIRTVCWRTTVKASSSSLAWSSTGGGDDMESRSATMPASSRLFCAIRYCRCVMCTQHWRASSTSAGGRRESKMMWMRMRCAAVRSSRVSFGGAVAASGITKKEALPKPIPSCCISRLTSFLMPHTSSFLRHQSL